MLARSQLSGPQCLFRRLVEILDLERLPVEVLEQQLGRDPEVREGEVVVGRSAGGRHPGTGKRVGAGSRGGADEQPPPIEPPRQRSTITDVALMIPVAGCPGFSPSCSIESRVTIATTRAGSVTWIST